MKRITSGFACLILLFCMTIPTLAQEMKGLRADLLGTIAYGEKEILDLENAIPQEKMAWRPNKDVRSVSEVYAHIAYSNYMFGNMLGAALPAGVPNPSQGDVSVWEKQLTEKQALHDRLQKSFEYFSAAVKDLPESALTDQVEFFGQKMTKGTVLLIGFAHQHEHLGQSIAYARMVGVVPPWTAAQMAAQQKKTK